MYYSYSWRSYCRASRILGTIGNSGRTEPLTIVGPEGIKDTVDKLRVIANWLPYEINIIENPKETFEIT